MIRDIVSFGISFSFVTVMVFVWMWAADSLRTRRVRRLYRSIPENERDRLLQLIDDASQKGSSCTLLVASDTEQSSPSDRVTSSHYGGQPYSEAGDTWPGAGEAAETPFDFLIQVNLTAPLPSPWLGQLVVIFYRRDWSPVIRLYPNASPERFVQRNASITPLNQWRLRPIRIPAQFGPSPEFDLMESAAISGLLDYDPVVLLQTVPGLAQEMSRWTRRPADLLAAILAPNHCGFGFEIANVVQLGGEPVWLRDEEDVLCTTCERPMRFLFQFGDLNGGNEFDDAGACYVFGCDQHPEHVKAIVQMG